MKLSAILCTALFWVTSRAAPVETAESTLKVPSEAILGYLDFGDDDNIAFLPFSNGTSTGLLFVNSTILDASEAASNLGKRSAEAWHWIRLSKGQPIYKREAKAEAEAEAWHWIRLSKGQPIYKRGAEAEAEAEAEAWHWINLNKGQPIYKREAEAEADAWHWINLGKGQPIY